MSGHPWLRGRFREGLYGRLREAGFRLTLPREAILDVLMKNLGHLSAEEIFFLVHKKYPGVGLATVYRTLDLLIGMGLLSKFDFGEGRSRYELANQPPKEHHHHLVCSQCGQIIDYGDFMEREMKFIKELEAELFKKYKFKINSYQIHFSGLCQNCQRS